MSQENTTNVGVSPINRNTDIQTYQGSYGNSGNGINYSSTTTGVSTAPVSTTDYSPASSTSYSQVFTDYSNLMPTTNNNSSIARPLSSISSPSSYSSIPRTGASPVSKSISGF